MPSIIAVEPTQTVYTPRDTSETSARRYAEICRAIEVADGVVGSLPQAQGLVWLTTGDPQALLEILDANSGIKWVQLAFAGVDNFVDAGILNYPVTVTCAKGSYAEQVAEHGLALTFALQREFVKHARTGHWINTQPQSLRRKKVTILGAGGIALEFIKMLQQFHCEIRVLRRNPDPVAGATDVHGIDQLHSILPDTDILVLALSLTAQTRGIIGARELALMPAHALVVNIARGEHIQTDVLVQALTDRTIAGAALDVTDPEPLPDSHPLWNMDNVLITSHCSDSVEFITDQLAIRVRENVLRLNTGQQLLGVVDPETGY